MKEGYKCVTRFIGARNLSTEERVQDDFYATEPKAAEWLLKIEDLNKRIWEPACGQGHLAKVFLRHGHYVLSTDLVDRGFGTGGIDFLKINDPCYGDIVTNPPFKYAQEFIEHALELIPEGNKVCMILRLQFLEGAKRKAFFEKYPPKRVWVSSSRIQFANNGMFGDKTKSMLATAWYVWEKGYKGDTILKWFN